MQPFHGSSYKQFAGRIRNHLRERKTEDAILDMLKSACVEAIDAQNAVLSCLEKDKVSRVLAGELLAGLVRRVDRW
jgi:hypothetical protein